MEPITNDLTPTSNDDLKATVASLMNYLMVLATTYPTGITQKELANLTQVTPAAVNKLKERLFPLCNKDALAFESKIILQPNLNVFEPMAMELVSQKNYFKLIKLLSTRYGEDTITSGNLHDRISEKIPFYGFLFTEEETLLGTKIILRYIRSFGVPLDAEKAEKTVESIKKLDFIGSAGEGFITGVLLGNALRSREFDWPIETEAELELFIGMRDKIFFMLKSFLTQFVQGLSILESLKTTEEKEMYVKVYEQTVDYYLRGMFSLVTGSLRTSLEKRGITFPDKFVTIENLGAEFDSTNIVGQ
jgi:hypothetical protein